MAASGRDYRAVARQMARQAGIPEDVFLAQIAQESGFNPTARSGAGAVGIAQIVPRWHPGVDATNPVASLRYAAQMDARNFKKYGDWQDVLSVYNSGRPWSQGQKIGETRNYVAKILAGRKNYPSSKTPLGTLASTRKAMGAPAPAPGLGSDLSRTALMQTLIGQQNAYLNHEDYSGPSFAQTFATLKAQQPQQPVVEGKLATPSGAIPVVNETGKQMSPAANKIVASAQKFLGTPYAWGGGGPGGPSKGFAQGANTVGFDCSSLLQYAYAQVGKKIPRVTYDQWRSGTPVGSKDMKPGDAVFFHPGSRGPEHVGIYVGNGKYIQAPKTGDVVKISNLSDRSDFMGARRW